MEASAMNAGKAISEAAESSRPVQAVPDWLIPAARAGAAVGALGSLAGLFAFKSDETWWMLLVNFLFWGGLAQGMVVWAAILRTAQASWAAGVNRIALTSLHFLPITLVMFALLYVGREHWLTWMHHDLPPAKAKWLNPGFFFARNAAALLFLTAMSYWYASLYRKLEVPDGQPVSDASAGLINKVAVGVVGAYVVVYTLLAFDMVMSLEPHWYSTLFGAYFFVGNQYASMGAIIVAATFLHRRFGLEENLGTHRFADMGNLMMGFGILFSGFVFAQWLTIWYGNLPEEAPYLMTRLYQYPWRGVGIAVMVLALFGPFLMLQSRAAKNTPARLAWIAACVLVGIWLERWMLVVPALSPDRLAGIGPLAWFIPLFCLCALVLVVVASLRSNPRVSNLDLALDSE